MNRLATLALTSTILGTLALAGCGQTNTTSNTASTSNSSAAHGKSTSNSTVIVKHNNSLIQGSATLAGEANLKKAIATALKEPNNVQAQVNAAQSAFMNGNSSEAITYYKKAIALQPKSAVYLTAFGNVYREMKNDPKSAIPFYQKATTADPSYAFGWYQLAVAEAQVGNTSEAKSVIAEGLQKVSTSNPDYAVLKQEEKQLESNK
ncbi:TPR repeat-containing protein [Alicyclobacillus hesperidum]|uniref:TPR repeat-containing protein n=1 Tax=Alicyclobacillus hesperidum TaxID=89784 RepID=A0A1H2XCT9_9BACL|nr:tetratricopeptide repeat protein [Alicyclobacillus hesperidum]SDW90264.1 TPR repeat-containing protein [Alicyclobacillus hesperidum]